ncbi:hypothetical protein BOQ62_05590 [Chryseobacterium sp. CH21]|uniref:hypothetical protein n=1 Tax=Chryseobacterium sp. CH21 TaxID=713556 RepID=UPI00100C132C|nr:hypothetical protein [Chryseobacterium sp. CH21]RXM40444.1 hypothetical protein BOQ62_05590 [Chryseobacterium sp. CH21]
MPPVVLSGNKSGWADQFRNYMNKYASNVPEIRQSYYNFHPYNQIILWNGIALEEGQTGDWQQQQV